MSQLLSVFVGMSSDLSFQKKKKKLGTKLYGRIPPNSTACWLYHLLLLYHGFIISLSIYIIYLIVPSKHIACETIDEMTVKFYHFLNFIFNDHKIA
jgi:hypothetical protein